MSTQLNTEEQLILDILKNLTKNPDDILITKTTDDIGILLSIKVNISDMPIVIGKGGSMSSSLRTIARALGKSNNVNLRLNFEEPEGSTKVQNAETIFAAPKPVENVSSVYIDSSSLDQDLDDLIIN
jgi:predicted RNA-binding protein YlqC (UPF0109 family)